MSATKSTKVTNDEKRDFCAFSAFCGYTLLQPLCGKLGLNFSLVPVVNDSTNRYLETIPWELLRLWP
jgi:hypothetical protein